MGRSKPLTWEDWVLATSLLDSAAHPSESFAALYKSRWKIEEAFKTLKHRLHLEGFPGELPNLPKLRVLIGPLKAISNKT